MYNMLNKLNKMLNEIGVKGQFPIALGYYHTQKKIYYWHQQDYELK